MSKNSVAKVRGRSVEMLRHRQYPNEHQNLTPLFLHHSVDQHVSEQRRRRKIGYCSRDGLIRRSPFQRATTF